VYKVMRRSRSSKLETIESRFYLHVPLSFEATARFPLGLKLRYEKKRYMKTRVSGLQDGEKNARFFGNLLRVPDNT